MATSTGLFGRDHELATLRDAIARARSGRRTAVVIEGEAGIGKSRLITEALTKLREPEDVVGIGHGVELFNGEVPYATVADTLRTMTRDVGESELRRAAGAYGPALMPLVPVLDPGGADLAEVDRMRLLPAYVHTVESLASDRLAWIVAEDLHWADTSSLDLLGYLIRVTDASRLLVLASVRKRDPEPDRSRGAFIDSLIALDGVARLPLAALAPDATAALVAELTGRVTEDADVVRLSALGRGNPLLTEQLVESLHSGRPTEIDHAMEARVRALDPSALRLVQLAALGEGHLQQRLVERVWASGTKNMDWDTARRAALESGLLTYEATEGEYRFAHALLRQAAEGTLTPADRVEGHRHWAECLAGLVQRQSTSHAPDPSLLVAVARHWAGTDNDAAAFGAAIEAADVSNRLGASDTAVELLLRAWSLWDHVADPGSHTDLQRDDLLRELCAASIPADRISEAVATMDAEINRTPRHADHVRHLQLRLTRAELTERLGAPMDETLYEDAAARIDELLDGSPTPLQGPALSALGWYMRWRVPELGDQLFEKAAEIIREAGPHAHFPYESAVGVQGLLRSGDLDAILAWIDDALARANSVYDATSLMAGRSGALYNDGQIRRSVEVAEAGLAMFPDARLAGAMWAYIALQAFDRHFAAGDWDRCAEILEACAGLEVEDFDVTTWLACRSAWFACARGDVAVAEAQVVIARDQLPDAAGAHLTHLVPVRVAQAEAAAARGRLEEAVGHLDPLLDEPALPTHSGLWPAVLLAARIVADDGAAAAPLLERIGDAAERLPQGARLFATCRAQVDADLARAARRDDVATWERVCAAWEDVGHVPYLGWAALRLATAHVQASDKAAAAEPLTRTWEIAQRLGAVPLEEAVVDLARRAHITLDTGGGASERDGTGGLTRLTPREIEVLRHVAKGESNEEIAAALFISPRTASVHVSRILTKLDVSSRSRAAAVAYQHGLIGHGEP